MDTDVLIIGCGIAGATAALELSRDEERRITVITRASEAEDSNSSHAQGGIVGRGIDDSAELLEEDIVRAGAGLSNPPAVKLLAEEGPRLLEKILVDDAGIDFDKVFGLEGAHSTRRILHVGDVTGQAIMTGVLGVLAEKPNVRLVTRATAVDLLTFPHHARDRLAVYRPPTCHGAYVFDHESGNVSPIVAPHTVLATGGIGQIFRYTTNPPGARGDGLAMAYRAGALAINAEYVQFHPTALAMTGTTKSLISEAVRGEGGILLTPGGERFMERYAPEERELAARDVAARAIYTEMLAHDYPHVLLDIASQREPAFVRDRFPWIYEHCLGHGIDISRQPIPVVPAAHYFCGGVLADLSGRTTLPGLHAVGEVACTGIHGANRLASTSLLEGLVWGARAAQDIRNHRPPRVISENEVPPWDESSTTHDADAALIQVDMQTVRNVMWHYVGLLRNQGRLDRATRELRRLWLNIEDFYRSAHISDALIGLRNAVQSGLLVARAAARNPTSRGCHYRQDYRPTGNATSPVDDFD